MEVATTIVQELYKMIEHGDLFLFSRRVLDLIADSNDMDLYRSGITYTDNFIKNAENKEQQKALSLQLLQEVQHINLPTTPKEQPILIAEGIKKSYHTNNFSLGPVSLTLYKGEVHGLVGENGNGKTTLLRLLAKELFQDNGTITYNLPNNNSKNQFDLRTKLIYIPQRTQKWYGSLMDNLKFALANYKTPPQEIETRVLLMVARLGLWKYKDLQWSELSSGYKMRFELARTLLRRPEILFLDEPLANLDILSQQIILEDLKSICTSQVNPIALILSSQQLYEVEKVSDKIIFLKNGKYIENAYQKEQEEDQALVVELDIDASRDELAIVFATTPATKIQNNGGNFIVHFDSKTTFNEVLIALAASNKSILYIRNISNSTRRYFV